MVLSVADALTAGLPVDVAVIVAVLVAESAAAAGTSTFTQTLVVAPALTDGVVVRVVVQVESRKLTGNVPPLEDIVYVSVWKPRLVIVTRSVTLCPTRAPSVWLVGARLAANRGAIGVTVGEPVAEGPWADVALNPSSTMEVTLDFSPGSILTRRCTVALPPDAMEKPDQLTVPPSFAPPSPALTNAVLPGTGSVTATPVAPA